MVHLLWKIRIPTHLCSMEHSVWIPRVTPGNTGDSDRVLTTHQETLIWFVSHNVYWHFDIIFGRNMEHSVEIMRGFWQWNEWGRWVFWLTNVELCQVAMGFTVTGTLCILWPYHTYNDDTNTHNVPTSPWFKHTVHTLYTQIYVLLPPQILDFRLITLGKG